MPKIDAPWALILVLYCIVLYCWVRRDYALLYPCGLADCQRQLSAQAWNAWIQCHSSQCIAIPYNTIQILKSHLIIVLLSQLKGLWYCIVLYNLTSVIECVVFHPSSLKALLESDNVTDIKWFLGTIPYHTIPYHTCIAWCNITRTSWANSILHSAATDFLYSLNSMYVYCTGDIISAVSYSIAWHGLVCMVLYIPLSSQALNGHFLIQDCMLRSPRLHQCDLMLPDVPTPSQPVDEMGWDGIELNWQNYQDKKQYISPGTISTEPTTWM